MKKKWYWIIGIVIIILLLFALPYWLFCCAPAPIIIDTCEQYVVQWCTACLQSGWSNDIKILPSDLITCMKEYYDIVPENNTCSYAKSVCKQFGVE